MTGILIIAIGVLVMAMTFIKPPIYWNSRRTMRMRKLFGDVIANIIYILISIMLIFYGVSILY